MAGDGWECTVPETLAVDENADARQAAGGTKRVLCHSLAAREGGGSGWEEVVNARTVVDESRTRGSAGE